MTDQERVIEALGFLALAKDRQPDGKVLTLYTKRLLRFPLPAVLGAVDLLMDSDDPKFPVVGAIIAAIPLWLREQRGPDGRAIVPSNAEAWAIAKRTISRWQRETRPQPESGVPAIDAAITELGGVEANQWLDAKSEGFVQRRFVEAFGKEIAKPEAIAWFLSGGMSKPPEIPGKEIPKHIADRLRREALEAGHPETIDRLLASVNERAAVLDGRPAPLPYALPAPLSEPLKEERRAELREEVKDKVAALAEAWTIPPPRAPERGQDEARDISPTSGENARSAPAHKQGGGVATGGEGR